MRETAGTVRIWFGIMGLFGALLGLIAPPIALSTLPYDLGQNPYVIALCLLYAAALFLSGFNLLLTAHTFPQLLSERPRVPIRAAWLATVIGFPWTLPLNLYVIKQVERLAREADPALEVRTLS